MQIENDLVEAGTITAEQKRISVPTPLPGDLAYGACGIAGLLCVIFAGWTTANPTIYRAGLAFQAIVPRASRFVVTLITGGIATIAGMFPGIAMKLLDFVAIYGMILMPMGAVIFVDFWLIRRFGLRSNYAEFSRTHFNWAAGLTWFLTLGTCVFLTKYVGHPDLLCQSARLVCRGRALRGAEQAVPEEHPAGGGRRDCVINENLASMRVVGRPAGRDRPLDLVSAGHDHSRPMQVVHADHDDCLVRRHAALDGPRSPAVEQIPFRPPASGLRPVLRSAS